MHYEVCHALTDSNFDLTPEAATQSQGLHFYDTRQPDVVVMDMTASPHETLWPCATPTSGSQTAE